MKKNKKKNRLFKGLALILLYTGVLMVSLPWLKTTIIVAKDSRTSITQVTNLSEVRDIPFKRVDPPTLNQVLLSKPNDQSAIGEIQIADLNIALPIFAGLDSTQLIYGVGSMYPDRNLKKANLVLLGHHLGAQELLFGNLVNARKGQEIQLSYLGKYYEYVIDQKQVVDEKDLAELAAAEKPQLTLVTCDSPDYTTKRVIVKANLVKQSSDKTKQVMKINETKFLKKKQQINLKRIVLPLFLLVLGLISVTYLIIKKI
ncbi:class A sortase [Enterococcus avium]|uniref:class A sortase n=1 Tax=Enterococcus malodoratus TaxID=71451 RepID=UPI0008B9F91F|nr:class A sortase [Enterococcus malodoratus]BBM19271.1 class A sortase [Enterococcus avium]SES87698.1 sortase A [Enterococcus malodoratus]